MAWLRVCYFYVVEQKLDGSFMADEQIETRVDLRSAIKALAPITLVLAAIAVFIYMSYHH
jgi:hypothetical protein